MYNSVLFYLTQPFTFTYPLACQPSSAVSCWGGSLGHHLSCAGLLVAVGRCNTQVRLSLIYVSGNLLDLRYLGSLRGMSYVRSHISKMFV